MSITSKFLTRYDGEEVFLYTLTNANGMMLKVLNYGGVITECHVPDRYGNFDDVVLGFNNFEDYLQLHPYFGALVGRVAGRLSGAQYRDHDKYVHLLANDGPNHLHGGARGFDKRLWQGSIIRNGEDEALELELHSADGDQGYPGNLKVKVKYRITSNQALEIEYLATTNRRTPLSMTQHSYFNLAGESSGNIMGHEFQIDADHVTSGDDMMTLSDRLESVDGQVNDLRNPKPLNQMISGLYKEHGDLYWINPKQQSLQEVAQVYEPKNGREMKVLTTLPCLQFYTGRYISDQWIGKSGNLYQNLSGFCLECQKYPNPDGVEGQGSNWLQPHETYQEKTVYQFSAR